MASCLGYSLPLKRDQIRLVRLLPNENEAAPLQCVLHNYCLQKSGAQTHLYEALSYVWGDPKVTVPIYLDKEEFQVTVNLHAALSRLRDDSFERIIWVDAICINQSNPKEREQQVKLMAKIYSKAHRVIVWLGNETEDTQGALEEIRIAANTELTDTLKKEMDILKIINLLNRPWFQRIWVLQEAAAARHIVIMCGYIEIDGYAFCLGVKALNISFTATPALQAVLAVLYLIEGAVLRSKYTINSSERFSLNIRCLPELIDMFHTRKASEIHDKVYALLGMSSDSPGEAGLQPDYQISWGIVFQKLVKYILGSNLSVEVPNCDQRAVIKSKGCILGQISLVTSNDQQHIKITPIRGIPFFSEDEKCEWTLRSSAKPIQEGDLICFLKGAPKPTIIRLCMDHFDVIVIAATPLGDNEELKSSNIPIPFSRDLVLVWDLENYTEGVDHQSEHENLIRINYQVPKNSERELAKSLERPTRAWNIALILGDVGHDQMWEKSRKAVEGYERVFGIRHASKIKHPSVTPLSWAAGNGFDNIVELLLVMDGIDPDLEDIEYCRTPLSWAANEGHEAIARKLLETGKVKIESTDKYGMTPLLYAAKKGYNAVVKLLINCGGNINAKDTTYSRTLLSWAAEGGHEVIVKLLLKTGKIEVDSKDRSGWTPLLYAAKGGHDAAVKPLLKNGIGPKEETKHGSLTLHRAARNGYESIVTLLLDNGANIEVRDPDRNTVLHYMARNGHQSIVKMLLEKGTDFEATDKYERTALHHAAENGHQSIVQILLEKGAGFETEDEYKRTALYYAAKNGHQSVAQMLLEKGANLEATDKGKWTALHCAASNGHQSVVQMLLEKGANLEAADKDKRTALHCAASNGHQSVVQMLLEKGANLEATDKGKWTALHFAASNGHQSVVQMLLEKGANLEATDKDKRTALYYAAKNGHQSVAQMLLEKGANLEATDKGKWTALHFAASNGHQNVVQMLLEKGANLEARDWVQWTALYCAASNGHQSVVQMLLEKGANIKVTTVDGWTALLMAATWGHVDVVQLLLGKGAVIEAQLTDRKISVTVVSENKPEAIVQLIRGRGAIVKGKTSDGTLGLYLGPKTGRELRPSDVLLEKVNDV